MTTATTTWAIHGLDATDAERLRAAGGERHVAASSPGYPCRVCLRDAEVGDELLLVSHDPFTVDSPYRSASPVFVHARPCPPHEPSYEIPEQLARRQLSVRAFDAAAAMTAAAVVDGRDLAATLQRFFLDPSTDRVHVHNASRGCWAATARRS